jgi:hypothetical protein
VIARVTDRQLWHGIAAGLLVIMGWYAAARTAPLLAYGNGGTLTLHQAQGLCQRHRADRPRRRKSRRYLPQTGSRV